MAARCSCPTPRAASSTTASSSSTSAGDSTLSVGTFRGDVAVEREDWAAAVRWFVQSAQAATPLSDQVTIDVQLITYALLRLGGFDDVALELDALARRLVVATGQQGLKPWMFPDRENLLRSARERTPTRTYEATPLRAIARRAQELVETALG